MATRNKSLTGDTLADFAWELIKSNNKYCSIYTEIYTETTGNKIGVKFSNTIKNTHINFSFEFCLRRSISHNKIACNISVQKFVLKGFCSDWDETDNKHYAILISDQDFVGDFIQEFDKISKEEYEVKDGNSLAKQLRAFIKKVENGEGEE